MSVIGGMRPANFDLKRILEKTRNKGRGRTSASGTPGEGMGASCSQCCGSKPSTEELQDGLHTLKEKLLDPEEAATSLELLAADDKDSFNDSPALVLSIERTASNDSLGSERDGTSDPSAAGSCSIHQRDQEELDKELHSAQDQGDEGSETEDDHQQDVDFLKDRSESDEQRGHRAESSSSHEEASSPPPPSQVIREEASHSFSAPFISKDDSYSSNMRLSTYSSEVFGAEDRIDVADKREQEDDRDNDADSEREESRPTNTAHTGDEAVEDGSDNAGDDDNDNESSDGDMNIFVHQRSSSRSPPGSPSGRRSSPHRR